MIFNSTWLWYSRRQEKKISLTRVSTKRNRCQLLRRRVSRGQWQPLYYATWCNRFSIKLKEFATPLVSTLNSTPAPGRQCSAFSLHKSMNFFFLLLLAKQTTDQIKRRMENKHRAWIKNSFHEDAPALQNACFCMTGLGSQSALPFVHSREEKTFSILGENAFFGGCAPSTDKISAQPLPRAKIEILITWDPTLDGPVPLSQLVMSNRPLKSSSI